MKYFIGALLLVFAAYVFGVNGAGLAAFVCLVCAGYGIRRATHG